MGDNRRRKIVELTFGWIRHKKEHEWLLMATVLFTFVLILLSIMSIQLFSRSVMQTCLNSNIKTGINHGKEEIEE